MLDRAAPSPAGPISDGKEAGALPLRFSDVDFEIGGVKVLADVALTVAAGPPTVLMAPNGAGKTTLLRLAMGLITPTAGEITFAGRQVAPQGTRAMVFQRPVMLRRSLADNVSFALRAAGRASDDRAMRRLLELTHLVALADRPARRLSGGEQQRLALARALARSPQILFLDEPTASLDPTSTKLVEEIIGKVAATGVKVVMSTHDVGQARRIAGDVVFLAQRRVVEHTPADRFFTNPQSIAARRFLAGDLII